MNNRGEMMMVIVSMTISLVGFVMMAEVIREHLLSHDAEINQLERSCRIANEIGQATNIDDLKAASQRACFNIDLRGIPLDGYAKTREGVIENIADKIARAWWIWLEGTKTEYFDEGLDKDVHTKPVCFIQYTFAIKKGLGLITPGALLEYLDITPYEIGDSSDRCGGKHGGFCEADVCAEGTKEIKYRKSCPPDTGHCCLRETVCESKGAECKRSCGDSATPHLDWSCGEGEVCCVDNSNYLTYLRYVQANTGAISIKEPLYSQDYELGGEKISHTYAIVFVSRQARFITEYLGIGHDQNINRILIAPFKRCS